MNAQMLWQTWESKFLNCRAALSVMVYRFSLVQGSERLYHHHSQDRHGLPICVCKQFTKPNGQPKDGRARVVAYMCNPPQIYNSMDSAPDPAPNSMQCSVGIPSSMTPPAIPLSTFLYSLYSPRILLEKDNKFW